MLVIMSGVTIAGAVTRRAVAAKDNSSRRGEVMMSHVAGITAANTLRLIMSTGATSIRRIGLGHSEWSRYKLTRAYHQMMVMNIPVMFVATHVHGCAMRCAVTFAPDPLR